MRVDWLELFGQDLAIDESGREWLVIAEAEFGGKSIARVRCWEPGKPLMLGKIVDCELTDEIYCTEADIVRVEREGARGIIASAGAQARLVETIASLGGRLVELPG